MRALPLATLLACAPPAGRPAPTPDPDPVQDEVVGGDALARDPEFLPDDALVAWQEHPTGAVWLAEVDPATGQWIPEDGRGVQVGRAPPIHGPREGPRPFTHNGPEWGADRDGPAVYFTGVDADGRNQPVRVDRDGTRTWLATGRPHRGGVLPQWAPDADRVALVYFLGSVTDLRAAWRWAGSDEEHPLPLAPTVDPAPRWIPGEDALATLQVDDDGWAQVARYDLHTGQTRALTSDAGHKSDPFVVDIPGGGRLLVTTRALEVPAQVDEVAPTEVAIYREEGDGFAPLHAFRVDDVEGGGPWAHYSAKPAVVGGEVLVTFVATRGARRADPAHVYVARADGSGLRRLTRGKAWRGDPEIVVIGGEPLLYYQAAGADGRRRMRVVRGFAPAP